MVLVFKGIRRRLVAGKRKIQGRSKGRVTIRHRGGALKRNYRFIEYFRQKWLEAWLFVMRIEYDPNRSAFIALCSIMTKGIYIYIIAVDKMVVGEIIVTNKVLGSYKGGSATQLKEIPDGFLINNIEMYKESGSKISRAAGTSSQVINQYNEKYSLLKLSSKEHRLIVGDCYATLGTVSNISQKMKKYTKAGAIRKKGFRPRTRGLAMNPVDHPHGGRTKGGMHWRNYGGKLTLNVSTRKGKNKTDKYIIVGHRKQRKIKING